MILDYLFPIRCALCQEETTHEGICPNCFNQLNIHTIDVRVGDLYGISAMSYHHDIAKRMILNFKHGDQPHLAKILGRFLYQVGQNILKDVDIIIPVPLHPLRLLKRHYNQAGLLARHVSKLCQKPLLNCMKRVKHTRMQGRDKKDERFLNVKNAFQIKKHIDLTFKKCVLIDDVVTSGATLLSVSQALRHTKVQQVTFLTLATAM